MENEIDLRKKHITMIIAIYVISKVLVHEVLNNKQTRTIFKTVQETEMVFFHFYGLTLIALLTDLLYSRF